MVKSLSFRSILLLGAAILALARPGSSAPPDSPEMDSKPYLQAVRRFADTVLESGRDRYGKLQTPLFVDGLHTETLEPARWKCRGETWVLSNFASQQPLLRVLDGLSALTERKEYARAAEDAARHALKHLVTPSGLLPWGGHLAWDLERERSIGQYAGIHELKGHQPYFRLMWRVHPEATRNLLKAIWAGHVLDWSTLDYNRHARTDKPLRGPGSQRFREDLEVPFPTEGHNLSFVNVTPPLLHAGVQRAVLDRNLEALTWARRLVLRWQQARHPKTGLCGGQLSYRRNDRAQDALGHVHPNINEARIVASYHQTCRYHHLPLAQMQSAEALVAAGGKFARAGHEFIRWASGDLKTYARHSYDPRAGKLVAMMTDGTPLRWQESRKGYYVPESFAPRALDGTLLWGCAMAYRLTRDLAHWRMLREGFRHAGLGDLGPPEGSVRTLRQDTECQDWRCIYVLLELHAATDDRTLLQLAGRIAQNLLKAQKRNGLFPRPGRVYARTGDEIPLAILHLAAAIEGRRSLLPPAVFDSRFFHCEYHGELSENQKKRADKRTYDNLVFYGGS